jgi:hypothetical protein
MPGMLASSLEEAGRLFRKRKLVKGTSLPRPFSFHPERGQSNCIPCGGKFPSQKMFYH